jgi:phosphomannomutase
MELNEAGVDSQLAIETSGHAAYKENYFLDDGAYLATKIVIKAAQLAQQGQALDVILASLEEPKEAVEYRFPIDTEEFGPYGDQVLADLKAWAQSGSAACPMCGMTVKLEVVEPNHEGVRINFRSGEGLSGWCLLRKSLHDPIMPLNIEVTEGSCQQILELLKRFLNQYDKLKL